LTPASLAMTCMRAPSWPLAMNSRRAAVRMRVSVSPGELAGSPALFDTEDGASGLSPTDCGFAAGLEERTFRLAGLVSAVFGLLDKLFGLTIWLNYNMVEFTCQRKQEYPVGLMWTPLFGQETGDILLTGVLQIQTKSSFCRNASLNRYSCFDMQMTQSMVLMS
jgi:hypothetical protein